MTQQLASVDELEIKKKISELRKKIQDCESEISELQKKCLHEFRKVWIALEKFSGEYRVKYYRCIYCEISKERGSEARTCYVCDGEMTLVGYIPGQGGGYHLEKCINCGRHSDADYYGVRKNSIPNGDIVL